MSVPSSFTAVHSRVWFLCYRPIFVSVSVNVLLRFVIISSIFLFLSMPLEGCASCLWPFLLNFIHIFTSPD